MAKAKGIQQHKVFKLGKAPAKKDKRNLMLAAVLRAGDFFRAAVLVAARDVGFCLAIRCLPDLRRARLSEAPLQGG